MRPSLALAVRSWASKLHHQRPLSPRESEQLLRLLKASFRRQLDLDHRLPKDQPVTSSTMTDIHINSILTNPMFSVSPRSRKRPSSSQSGLILGDLKVTRELDEDPIGFLGRSITAGTASVSLAATCLNYHGRQLLQGPERSHSQAMKRSGAGTKVYQWFRSSGIASLEDMIMDKRFIRAIAYFLVAEKNLDPFWELLFQLKPTSLPSTQESSVEDVQKIVEDAKYLLLRDFLKAKQRLLGVPASIHFFLDVAHKVDSFGSPIIPQRAFLRTAYGLAMEATCKRSSAVKVTDIKVYDEFIVYCSHWDILSAGLLLGWLQLYHPTNPAPAVALQYFKAVSQNLDNLPPALHKSSTNTVKLGLETADLLIRKDKNYDDAAWLLEFLRTNFPKQFGPHVDLSKAPPGEANSEETNLRLLEQLNVHAPSY